MASLVLALLRDRIDAQEVVTKTDLGASIETVGKAFDEAFYYLSDEDLELDDPADLEPKIIAPLLRSWGLRSEDLALYIGGLDVPPRARGLGYGRAFVEQLERWAAGQGAKISVLYSTATTGGPSKGFWRAMGYEMVWSGRWDDGVMAKRLEV